MGFLRAFVTVAYAGRAPVAPGTVGSLAAIPFIYLWQLLIGTHDLITLAVIILLTLLGSWASTVVARNLQQEDPQEIVIDEFVGQWLALLAAPMLWWYWLAAFVLFRVFDIWKPGIIGKSQDLPGGLGIMADDVLAGVFAFLILQGVHALL